MQVPLPPPPPPTAVWPLSRYRTSVVSLHRLADSLCLSRQELSLCVFGSRIVSEAGDTRVFERAIFFETCFGEIYRFRWETINNDDRRRIAIKFLLRKNGRSRIFVEKNCKMTLVAVAYDDARLELSTPLLFDLASRRESRPSRSPEERTNGFRSRWIDEGRRPRKKDESSRISQAARNSVRLHHARSATVRARVFRVARLHGYTTHPGYVNLRTCKRV